MSANTRSSVWVAAALAAYTAVWLVVALLVSWEESAETVPDANILAGAGTAVMALVGLPWSLAMLAPGGTVWWAFAGAVLNAVLVSLAVLVAMRSARGRG